MLAANREALQRRFRRNVALVESEQSFLRAVLAHQEEGPQFELALLCLFWSHVHVNHSEIRQDLHGRPSTATPGHAPLAVQAISALHLRELDANGDGEIDPAEIGEVLRMAMGSMDGEQADGNRVMYSADNLVARFANRRHPRVAAELDKWWRATQREILGRDKWLHRDEDADLEHMNQEEYSHLYRRLLRAFAEDGDDEDDMTPEQALGAAAEDWEKDSHGSGRLCRDDFLDAIFALADVWTETTDVQEYVDFLAHTYKHVFHEKHGAHIDQDSGWQVSRVSNLTHQHFALRSQSVRKYTASSSFSMQQQQRARTQVVSPRVSRTPSPDSSKTPSLDLSCLRASSRHDASNPVAAAAAEAAATARSQRFVPEAFATARSSCRPARTALSDPVPRTEWYTFGCPPCHHIPRPRATAGSSSRRSVRSSTVHGARRKLARPGSAPPCRRRRGPQTTGGGGGGGGGGGSGGGGGGGGGGNGRRAGSGSRVHQAARVGRTQAGMELHWEQQRRQEGPRCNVWGDGPLLLPCRLCSAAERSVIFSCGHMAVCATCAQRCATCPTCRRRVRSVKQRDSVLCPW